jgi:hypothetical protein
MDGLEAARVLRGARETKDIPSRQQPHFFVRVSEIVFGRRLVTLNCQPGLRCGSAAQFVNYQPQKLSAETEITITAILELCCGSLKRWSAWPFMALFEAAIGAVETN